MRYEMYVFDNVDDIFIITEINDMGEEQILAKFDDELKAKKIFRNLKKGNAFEGETPKFFCPVEFVENSINT